MVSPGANWFTIGMVLVLSIFSIGSKHQVDFVLEFPQANIEFGIYMEIPQVIKTKDGSRMVCVLKLLKNLYGQMQGSRVLKHHLTKGIKEILFQKYKVDTCMFYQCGVIFIGYTEDGIFAPQVTQ